MCIRDRAYLVWDLARHVDFFGDLDEDASRCRVALYDDAQCKGAVVAKFATSSARTQAWQESDLKTEPRSVKVETAGCKAVVVRAASNEDPLLPDEESLDATQGACVDLLFDFVDNVGGMHLVAKGGGWCSPRAPTRKCHPCNAEGDCGGDANCGDGRECFCLAQRVGSCAGDP